MSPKPSTYRQAAMIPPKIDSAHGAFQNPFAYPCKSDEKHPLPSGIESTRTIHHPGMTLLDYFAGQFIARGDTPQDAYRNAELALKEREGYL